MIVSMENGEFSRRLNGLRKNTEDSFFRAEALSRCDSKAAAEAPILERDL
jgi:hypothetical protein